MTSDNEPHFEEYITYYVLLFICLYMMIKAIKNI